MNDENGIIIDALHRHDYGVKSMKKRRDNKAAAYRRTCIRQYNINECRKDMRLEALERKARAAYYQAELERIHAEHQMKSGGNEHE